MKPIMWVAISNLVLAIANSKSSVSALVLVTCGILLLGSKNCLLPSVFDVRINSHIAIYILCKLKILAS